MGVPLVGFPLVGPDKFRDHIIKRCSPLLNGEPFQLDQTNSFHWMLCAYEQWRSPCRSHALPHSIFTWVSPLKSNFPSGFAAGLNHTKADLLVSPQGEISFLGGLDWLGDLHWKPLPNLSTKPNCQLRGTR